MPLHVVTLSDTHNLHDRLPEVGGLPEGDILVHSGDIMNAGYFHELGDIRPWAERVAEEYDAVYFTPGNHDWAFADNFPYGKADPGLARHILEEAGWTVLVDEATVHTHEGHDYKIYGSPWQPWFYDWAFNLPRNGPAIEQVWSQIPDDTEILLTHGPAYGLRDPARGTPVGCEKLLDRLKQLDHLKLHVFGHIHSGAGHDAPTKTTPWHVVNASVVNERYDVVHHPIVVTLDGGTPQRSQPVSPT
jgi:Icc-related predicted phosphoesterase